MNTCTCCHTKINKLNRMFTKKLGHNNKLWHIVLCPSCTVAVLNTALDHLDYDNLHLLLNKIGKEE